MIILTGTIILLLLLPVIWLLTGLLLICYLAYFKATVHWIIGVPWVRRIMVASIEKVTGMRYVE